MNILYEDKSYEIDFESLSFVLTHLAGIDTSSFDEKEIKKYMKKYKLFDEVFLTNISKL